jgi:hypothetical protein
MALRWRCCSWRDRAARSFRIRKEGWRALASIYSTGAPQRRKRIERKEGGFPIAVLCLLAAEEKGKAGGGRRKEEWSRWRAGSERQWLTAGKEKGCCAGLLGGLPGRKAKTRGVVFFFLFFYGLSNPFSKCFFLNSSLSTNKIRQYKIHMHQYECKRTCW